MGEDKSDWEIVGGLATAILVAQGQPAPNLRHPRDTLDHMLQKSPHGLTLAQVEGHPHGLDLGELQPGRLPERLHTPDKTIRCLPDAIPAELARFAAQMAQTPADSLLLIGRRHLRSNNSWLHNSKRLLKGPDRCTLMIHPDDAEARGIADGQPVTISSRVGAVTAPAELTDSVMPGTVSLPHGWGHGRAGVQLSVAKTRPGVSLNDLTDRQRFDPLSGNAALNGTPVTVLAA
jgi:anaerobic selenocysteine-containing dehydrogenase